VDWTGVEFRKEMNQTTANYPAGTTRQAVVYDCDLVVRCRNVLEQWALIKRTLKEAGFDDAKPIYEYHNSLDRITVYRQ
jgi:hypothetical protein